MNSLNDCIDEAERIAGHRFSDPALLLTALTHSSWINEAGDASVSDNERLEFLGDAVIDLLVSEYLMARFPAAREGELSKLRAAVVDEAGLAAMARALSLGELPPRVESDCEGECARLQGFLNAAITAASSSAASRR